MLFRSLVVFRVHYLAYPIQHIQDMLRKYRTIMVELLIDSATPLDIINLREERLILKYIVTNNSDLDKLTGAKENIVLCQDGILCMIQHLTIVLRIYFLK